MSKVISLEEFKNLIKARVTEAPSLRQLAPTLGTTAATLSRLLVHDDAKPGPSLLKRMGYRRIEVYEQLPK
jgi:hypothetical protein